MKSATNSPSDRRALLILTALAVIVLINAIVGCTTVSPRIVESPAASWDGTNQNSGFIGWSGTSGIITPHARDRYNGLIETYGKKFVPPLVTDYGITATTSNVYLITPEALADFALMNRWHKVDAVKP
jgi:hypothetical protein